MLPRILPSPTWRSSRQAASSARRTREEATPRSCTRRARRRGLKGLSAGCSQGGESAPTSLPEDSYPPLYVYIRHGRAPRLRHRGQAVREQRPPDPPEGDGRGARRRRPPGARAALLPRVPIEGGGAAAGAPPPEGRPPR